MPLFGQDSEVLWQEAMRRRGGERTGKQQQARLEPVSPRAMKPVNGGLIGLHHSAPLTYYFYLTLTNYVLFFKCIVYC